MANKETKENSERKIVSDFQRDDRTALALLLRLSNQEDFLPFDCILSEFPNNAVEYPGGGEYSHVFKAANSDKIFKCIPLWSTLHLVDDGDLSIKRTRPLKVVSEAVTAHEMTCLAADNRLPSRTSAFAPLVRLWMLKGPLPQPFIDVALRTQNTSHRLRPTYVNRDNSQEKWVVIQTLSGGIPLEHNLNVCCNAARVSIFAQLALAFAVAEAEVDFEHCDMHLENVLIAPPRGAIQCRCHDPLPPTTTFENVVYQPYEGPRIMIIDYSRTRVRSQGVLFHSNPEEIASTFEDCPFLVPQLLRNQSLSRLRGVASQLLDECGSTTTVCCKIDSTTFGEMRRKISALLNSTETCAEFLRRARHEASFLFKCTYAITQ